MPNALDDSKCDVSSGHAVVFITMVW